MLQNNLELLKIEMEKNKELQEYILTREQKYEDLLLQNNLKINLIPIQANLKNLQECKRLQDTYQNNTQLQIKKLNDTIQMVI